MATLKQAARTSMNAFPATRCCGVMRGGRVAALPARRLAAPAQPGLSPLRPSLGMRTTHVPEAIKQAPSSSPSPEEGSLPAAGGNEFISKPSLPGFVAKGALLALVAAAGGVWINTFSDPSCQVMGTCTPIPLYMKVPLIATHLFTFALVPATMYVFYTRSKELKAAGAQDPFTAMVGLSYIAVAIAAEMGWHVTQEWYYIEEYAIMNFMFYFFLIMGTSLWAIGIKEDDTTTDIDEKIDIALWAAPWVAGFVYLLGAAVTHTKVPVYILLSFEYAVLTYRFWKLLKTPKVFLFPLFSVGVNLTFIALLNYFQKSPILNPLFHILHDAAGTELGVGIIAAIVYYELAGVEEGQQKAK